MYKGKSFIFQAFILLGLLAVCIQLGASIYESRVVIPIWIENLPQSAKSWNPDIQPVNFWGPNGMFLSLAILLNIIGLFVWKGTKRKWLLYGVLLQIAIILSTLLFFVPILTETIFSDSKGLSDESIVSKSMQWYNWNWVRMAAVVVSWYCFLKAFDKKPIER